MRHFHERDAVNFYFKSLMDDLKMEGPKFNCQLARISEDEFLYLCAKIRNRVEKKDSFMRFAVTVEEKPRNNIRILGN